MRVESENLLDAMAEAIYVTRRGTYTGLPFYGLGETEKQPYRQEAKAAADVVRDWIDDKSPRLSAEMGNALVQG